MTKDGNRQGKWVRRSREEWQALLKRFDARHDSVSAFCARESISEASYYRWRGLLSGGVPQPANPPSPSGFLDLGHLHTSHPGPRLDLKLDLGGGLVLHLVRG
ncbi:MAG: IS66 family insertion sequence element accessory protein TnpB [Pseudomonadota bacterium]|nr:IS66 family insertion sequence element accessory protein TnpB [Pseudomonadota bacterium]MDP1572887.1 IS66 family insertion sequence element accessory protein TnpB [Pseudomonadota bacterium]MDP1905820.1 IS66 family insertion sequence element accessory protein TnpB [Pseudomonadota bacterium]